VTVAFDKKRCKELGLAVVCVVVAGWLHWQCLVSNDYWAGWLCRCRLEPCKVLGSSIVGRRGVVGWALGFLGWPFFGLHFFCGYSMNLPNEGLDG
jgi:aquaporin-4